MSTDPLSTGSIDVAPAPEVSAAVADEQAHLDVVYGRLDQMRATAARRLAAALRGDDQGGTQGGTMQARGERDSTATMYSDQIARYDAVENGLCFGRLDRSDGTDLHIGRIGIHTFDSDDALPLLMDWRAPAARPFYLATVASPEGVRRRRHIATRGRTVMSVEDEALDAAGLASTGTVHDALTNENALLSALGSARTGQMADIVETIQAEQDRIIRAEHAGPMVVQGGPGTGKTAVALHRAAYLLYTHRAELSRRAVLIVGPSPTFLRYIGRVLPGLGESAVVLATIGTLLPGVAATGVEDDRTAEIKGRPEMADVMAHAVADRQRVPEEPFEVPFDRDVLRFDAALVRPVRDRARRSHAPHNRAHPSFVAEMVDALARQIADRIGADVLGGENLLTEGDIATFRDEIREDASVMAEIAALWPLLKPEDVVGDLWAEPERLASAAPYLSDAELGLLRRGRDAAWTAADVPLLDEVADLLGTDESEADAEAEREQRAQERYAEGVLEILSRDIEDDEEVLMAYDLIDAARLAGRQADRDGLTVAQRAAADRQWAYGHVIVDEAQELSAMAWRVLMRRCPSRSMTLVGDVAQTSDPAAPGSWSAVLKPFVGDRWHVEELTVNYRTPGEIMDLATNVLAEIDPALRVPRSVRRTGVPPSYAVLDDLRDVVAGLAADVGDGRVAVIAPQSRLAEVRVLLRDVVGEDSAGGADLSAPVIAVDVREAKGLEFDAVAVVDPDGIAGASPRGLGDLYVAYTRATQRLVIVS